MPPPTLPNLNPLILHARLLRTCTTNPALYNHLITLYSLTPTTLPLSLRLFHHLPFKPTSISWTSIISAFSHHSPLTSIALFTSMLQSSPSLPNQGTISSLLKTFTSLSSPFCLQLHSLSLKLALAHQTFSGSALIRFYAKSRLFEDARQVFDEISLKDEVCYSAMIVGFSQNGRPIDSIELFKMMRRDGVWSTAYSVSGGLRAAAQVAGLELTRVIHCHAFVVGLEWDCAVGTALLDAYGKSGCVFYAQRVFDEMGESVNVVTWNAMIGAYGQHGDVDSAKWLFGEMTKSFAPDECTFLAVLTACSNAGLVEETERWLDLMRLRYKVKAWREHYNCVVAAMARVGKLEEAEQFVLAMPFEPDAAAWRTLLVGCVVHNAVELGRAVGQRLIELDPGDESTYIMLANIYSAVGKEDDMGEVLGVMRDRGVRKEKGRSWTEVKGEVHEFTAGDMRHWRRREIYEKLRELVNEVKSLGYEEEDEGVRYHSERLALAFGVVSGSAIEGKVLRVVKNLRACWSCHEFFKYVSKVLGREIVVRDVNRYHRFENGGCSCQDCW